MPMVRVGDIQMFYQDVGEGDPLLLIMGFGGDHMAWAMQMADFSARHRVIAFDNRGVGQTDAPDQPYTTRQMADERWVSWTRSASTALTCSGYRWAA